MGTGTLNKKTGVHVVVNDDFNEIINALSGDFVGRSAVDSAASPDERLGTPVIPWAELHATSIFVGGSLIDFDALGGGGDSSNQISSGVTRADSSFPDFLRADGSTNAATLQASANDFAFTANSIGAIITTDISITGLTVAPSSNNTCLINDSGLSGQNWTKYKGEQADDVLTIDTVGTEISDRIGQYAVFKAGTEYMLAYIKDATTLSNIKRGYFLDDAGAPIVRETLANNDTLTLMQLGWVFVDADGVTIDVSYNTPVYSAIEPSAPVADDYWFNITLRQWNRYNGSDFVVVNRILSGFLVIDTANCVASRCVDFNKTFSDVIDIELDSYTDEQIYTKKQNEVISVYGNTLFFNGSGALWDITTDLETGLTATLNTLYYLYITENGEAIISDERPVDRRVDLKGLYHPFHSWRFVGLARTDGDIDFEFITSNNTDTKEIVNFLSSGTFYPVPFSKVKVTITGAGGGTLGAGGSSSFGGSIVAATGGGSGDSGNGGVGSNGDYNISGGDGGATIAGSGGTSFWGGGGRGGNGGIGSAGQARGSGGGGGDTRGGGGAGGTAIKSIVMTRDELSVIIGSGGVNGAGSDRGGDGSGGICMIEYLRGSH